MSQASLQVGSPAWRASPSWQRTLFFPPTARWPSSTQSRLNPSLCPLTGFVCLSGTQSHLGVYRRHVYSLDLWVFATLYTCVLVATFPHSACQVLAFLSQTHRSCLLPLPLSPACLLARMVVRLTSRASIALESWEAFLEAGVVLCLLMEGSRVSHRLYVFAPLCSKGDLTWLKPVLA